MRNTFGKREGCVDTHILNAWLLALDGHVALHVLCAEAKSCIATVESSCQHFVFSSVEDSTYLLSHHTR